VLSHPSPEKAKDGASIPLWKSESGLQVRLGPCRESGGRRCLCAVPTGLRKINVRGFPALKRGANKRCAYGARLGAGTHPVGGCAGRALIKSRGVGFVVSQVPKAGPGAPIFVGGEGEEKQKQVLRLR
jgi:hypothetical protein